ncbi:integrase, catalytic region, zinc finger, CCHC-type containing protein [Tanacetum coccineum]
MICRPIEVNAAGQHINTTSLEVNTGRFKLNTVDPSVSTASSNNQDNTKDMFKIGASHTLEATHVEFFSFKLIVTSKHKPSISKAFQLTFLLLGVNSCCVAKDLWEKIKLLMQGTLLTKQERECKLYDEFDKFTYKKGESLHEYYLRFTLLLNDMNIYKMPLEQFQVNTKFLNTLPDEWSKFVTDVKLVKDLHTTNVDQLHAYLEQHERHANEVRLMHERNSDPLALVASHQLTQSAYQSHLHTYPNSQPQHHVSSYPSSKVVTPYQTQQFTTSQSTPLSITYPSNEYQSSVHHNVYSPQSSIPQLEYAPTTYQHQQSEFSQPDSGLIVPVFQKGDDPIDAINHMMSFLTAVVTSRYPTTNNQLRTSSNPRQQATIYDGKVTVQPVQGRQTTYAAGTTRKYTPGASGSNTGKQQTVICYNCKGEGHMSRQCTKPKRKRDDSWFKEKVLLVQAQAHGQILNEEELAFLADPDIPEDALAEVHNHDNMNNDVVNQAVQMMPSSQQSNVVNHSETKITSDSNIIPYSQYVIESQQATVQKSNSSVQQDDLILSVIEQLKTQVANCTKTNLENKSVNDTLTAELERYKEQVKVLKEGQNVDLRSKDNVSDTCAQSVEIDLLKQTLSEHLKEKESLLQTVTLLKNDFKKEESRNIDREITLEKQIKQLDNIVFKRDQSAQTVHMLTKPQFFYDNTTKQALGFQNPFYLQKAQQSKPKLYVGDIIVQTNPIVIPNSKETLALAEESRSKMLLKHKDNMMLEKEKQVDTTPIDYVALNQLYKDFPTRFVPQTELSAEQAFWSQNSVNSSEPTLSIRPTNVEVPKELPKVSIVNTSLKKLKHHLANFFFRKGVAIKALQDEIRNFKGKALVDNNVSNHPRVKQSTSVSGPQPSGNTKKDKIQQTPSSTLTNKVEAHPRKVKFSLKNKDCVVAPKGTAHVQHSKLNANYKLKCVKCNSCMLSDNHDLCVLDFINNVNARAKSRSVKKNSKRKVWKPTGKVFTNIGYIWRPTGRTFTIVGNACPLTRITTTTEVPLRKSSALDNKTPKPVITLDNETEFVNQTLREYYEKVGISHETSVAHSPQQNGVVERRNRTLIEAARTMLIYAKAPLFLWAEAVATACYTQNRSMIRRRHGKTPYELLHNKPPDLSYLHVFGALCYPTNDSENLGKLQPKADIGIFIGYAPTKKAFRIYNRRTRRIVETIHVDFDELTAMASEHNSLRPALHEITPATIGSGLVPNPHPSTPFVPPSRTDWDMLFQPLFDEFLNPSPSVDHPAPEVVAPSNEVIAPVLADSTGSPSSTTVDQDAPSPSNSQTTPETEPLVIPNDVEEDNHDIEVAHMGNDMYFGVLIPEIPSDQSSSSDSIHTIVHPDHQIFEHNSKWTKDHPLENIIGELARPVSTRLQLPEASLFCTNMLSLTAVEPRRKRCLTQAVVIEAMQE